MNSDGQVKATAVGNCQILCEAADGGGASFAYDITVVQPVTKLEATQKELRVKAEHGVSLSSLISIFPCNASNKEVEWTLKDKKGKVVPPRGAYLFDNIPTRNYSVANDIIKFAMPGKYTLIATTTDGSKLSASLTIYVESRNSGQ